MKERTNNEVSFSQTGRAKSSWFRILIRRTDFTVAAATLIIYLFFSIFTDAFFTAYNQFNILRTAACYVFVALSQGMVQISGGISLAVGQVGGFSGMCACFLMQDYGAPIWLATIVAVIVGCALGWLTGWLVETLKLPAFVVTLAMSYILNGLILGITEGFPFTKLPENIVWLGRAGFGSIIPLVTVLAIIVLILVFYLFKFTVIGRQMLASGGNREAARLSGVPVKKVYLVSSLLSGFFSGLSAMIWISRAGSMQASLGSDWMMVSFSVAMLGASKAGFISPFGFFFSAVLFTLIKNGLVIAHVNPYYENCFLGFIVLFAISIDSVREIIAAKAKHL
jgi:ribose transport system permease protein